MIKLKKYLLPAMFVALALTTLNACGAAATPTPTAVPTNTVEPTAKPTETPSLTEELTPTAVPTDAVEPTDAPDPTGAATPAQQPTAASKLSPTELKYRLLETLGGSIVYCDRDLYPIARDENGSLATQFPEIEKNAEEFEAILRKLNLQPTDTLSQEQKLSVYKEHKKLSVISLEPKEGNYRFSLVVGGDPSTSGSGGAGEQSEGVIDLQGSVTVEKRTPIMVDCPICLAAGTRIDTPKGSAPVKDLRKGMEVWTVDASGKRQVAAILRTSKTLAPSAHEMVHLVLADGRELLVSPGHPTADGRTIGDLSTSDAIGGVRIKSVRLVPYGEEATYDILPSGETGYYWANGILVGSTLAGESR